MDDAQFCLQRTREWVEKAVVGLQLCPFAVPVHRAGLIHYEISEQTDTVGLLQDLERALLTLHQTPAQEMETTLLIHPRALLDFHEYNDFLDLADALVESLDLTGELQVASFHPQYQFAGTQPDDIENYTNRSPYPMLHLLRETSISRAVAGALDADAISDRNIRTLRRLGHEGWNSLWLT